MKHFKIFIDTNQIRTAPDHGDLRNIFGLAIDTLSSFLQENKKGIKTNKITISIPDIVRRECLQQRLEKIDSTLEEANQAIERLSKLGHSKTPIKSKKNYKKILEEECQSQIKKYGIELLPMPNLKSEDLIERAVNKIKPFNDNTAGFKDTLIFLSILEDAKSGNADVYILCTKNASEFGDHVIKEFETQTGKKLYIVEDLNKIQEKLDTLLPLRLDLKKRNAKVKNFIESNGGTLLVDINSQIEDKRTIWRSAIDISDYSYDLLTPKKEKALGYNLQEIKIKEINDLGENKYKVNLEVVTEPKYKDNMHEVFNTYTPINLKDSTKTFEYAVICDLSSETFSIEKRRDAVNLWGRPN